MINKLRISNTHGQIINNRDMGIIMNNNKRINNTMERGIINNINKSTTNNKYKWTINQNKGIINQNKETINNMQIVNNMHKEGTILIINVIMSNGKTIIMIGIIIKINTITIVSLKSRMMINLMNMMAIIIN